MTGFILNRFSISSFKDISLHGAWDQGYIEERKKLTVVEKDEVLLLDGDLDSNLDIGPPKLSISFLLFPFKVLQVSKIIFLIFPLLSE